MLAAEEGDGLNQPVKGTPVASDESPIASAARIVLVF